MAQGDPEPNDYDGEGDDGGLASVVLIDRREDIAGICGRVDTAPTFAVVLHAPDGNRQLSTELGIRRLQRHVEESGKAVAIATSSVSLSSRARQVGIPVARKPQYVRWDAGGRRVVRMGSHSVATPAVGRYVQLLVILAVAAVFLGLTITMAPSGTVIAYPPSETIAQTITITASEDQESIEFEGEQIVAPASRITGNQRITLALRTTGRALVGTGPATVVVNITNPTAAEVVVSKGTVLLAGPQAFAFELGGDADLRVPGGGTVTQGAIAREPGTVGNVAANTVTSWQDPRFQALTVTNPQPGTGGVDEDRQAVDARDIIGIKALAESLKQSEAVRQGLLKARPLDAVFLGTAETAIDYIEPSTPAGTPTDLLLLDVDVEVTALAILQETLDDVARRVLVRDQGRGELVVGSVTALETGARQVNAETNTITTELRVQGEFARDLTRDDLRAAVKGKSTGDAKSTLAERYGIQDAEVKVSPGWAPWLPRFDFRIDVEMRGRPAEVPAGDSATANDTTLSPATTPAAGP